MKKTGRNLKSDFSTDNGILFWFFKFKVKGRFIQVLELSIAESFSCVINVTETGAALILTLYQNSETIIINYEYSTVL